MTGARKVNAASVEEYLADEQESPVKHEYVGGSVYAMVGARNAHNIIASNALVSLGSRLKGKRCRPFNSDTKIRLQLPNETRFYYPDASVICIPNSQTDVYQDKPAVVIEVISNRTRRIDEGEKRDAYLNLPSLFAYVLLEQERPSAVVWRRKAGAFVREVYDGMESIIELESIECSLPLSEVYEGVEFSKEDGADSYL